MPLQVPADPAAVAYATVDAADAKAELRVGGLAWLALSDDQKDQALATGASDIDSLEEPSPGFVGGFIGDRATDTQTLAWPRSGTKYASDSWPQLLVDANIELAFTYAPAFAAPTDVVNANPQAGNVKREKVGPLETEYFAATTESETSLKAFPTIVQRLLASLVRVAVAGQWLSGSGVVVRGS